MSINLFQGDCLEIMSELPDNSIDAVVCDPPYGTTACKWDTVVPLEDMWEQLWRVSKPNTPIVLFATQPFTSNLIMSQIKYFKYTWVWDKFYKTGFLNSKRQPLRKNEDLCIFYKKQCVYNPIMQTGFLPYKSSKEKIKKYNNNTDNYSNFEAQSTIETKGERYPDSIIQFKMKRSSRGLHPTQKPLELMEYLVKTYTNEGDRVLDFTMGSGTTGVACKNLRRKFIGIEKDEEYFKIAKERIDSSG